MRTAGALLAYYWRTTGALLQGFIEIALFFKQGHSIIAANLVRAAACKLGTMFQDSNEKSHNFRVSQYSGYCVGGALDRPAVTAVNDSIAFRAQQAAPLRKAMGGFRFIRGRSQVTKVFAPRDRVVCCSGAIGLTEEGNG